MQYWSLYFFAKFALYFNHAIKFNWFLNLLLAVFVTFSIRHPRWRIARQTVAVIAAVALLYSESSLPPPARLLAEAGRMSGYSFDYLLELLARFINLWYVFIFAVMVALYALLANRLRFSSFVFVGILCIPLLAQMGFPGKDVELVDGGTERDPGVMLNAFYAEEKGRKLSLPSIAQAKHPFDIVILQPGELSWDDLAFVDAPYPRFLNRFDAVMLNFNSATSHSTPAARRLMRGSCGQSSDSVLAATAAPGCALFPGLKQAGYDTAVVMNHNGRYNEFGTTISAYAGTKAQEGKWGAVTMHGFDGTPVYDDFSVLSKWWSKHHSHPGGKPIALYYNTITLHDGTTLDHARAINSVQSYKPRLDKLLQDFDQFIDQVEQSKRPTVIILIPAHGVAMRGDTLQAAGIREIPSPKLTLVPVAIKLVGLERNKEAGPPLEVKHPISYFGLFSLVADLMADSPYEHVGKSWAERLALLPETSFVSENENIIIMRRNDGYVMRSAEDLWIKYNSD
ncbi:cellulose biosynthesis protein BcsG [Herminiimonas sp. KBW02]|uniref:cellulose biosynthesis protein BcsG n=1 Tax=Herminiimonas sp. KBW02 TaxID=2153363 RepID=UPI000F5A7C5C|nr:cellulose biosynthesis protein BcsG [Herminiimonas sp. KBW02]RQO36375.1 cellulose biosynthesis protein BcsG [Herminiimonas sp. KBW02]